MTLQNKSNPKTVLIIDDDPDIVDFLRDLLELEGFAVIATAKADDLEKLQQNALPDLILLDVFLSGRDGREIVASLKQQEETKHIPVLMFSAYAQIEATVREAGANDFVSKPFNLEILLTKMQTLL